MEEKMACVLDARNLILVIIIPCCYAVAGFVGILYSSLQKESRIESLEKEFKVKRERKSSFSFTFHANINTLEPNTEIDDTVPLYHSR